MEYAVLAVEEHRRCPSLCLTGTRVLQIGTGRVTIPDELEILGPTIGPLELSAKLTD